MLSRTLRPKLPFLVVVLGAVQTVAAQTTPVHNVERAGISDVAITIPAVDFSNKTVEKLAREHLHEKQGQFGIVFSQWGSIARTS